MNSKILDFILGYEKSEKSFSKSKISSGKHFTEKIIGGIGYSYSKKIFNSSFAKLLSRICTKITEASIKSYGILLFSFGLATLMVNFAEYYFRHFTSSPTIALVIGAVISVISFPLLFIDVPLVKGLQKWKFSNEILFDVMCLRKSHSVVTDKCGETKAIVPVVIGVFLAAIGYLTSLPMLALVVSALIFIALAFSSPEFALMCTLLFLPVIPALPYPTAFLSFAVGITLLAFVGKVILGKRLFHFEQYDAVLLLFMLFTLISGIFNKGFASFEKSAILVLLSCAYFLTSNIIVNRRLAENAVKIIIFSSIPTAIAGFVTYYASPTHPEWIDPVFEGSITARAYSTFANPNVYAVYLLVTTIFSLAFAIDKAHKSSRPFFAAAFLLNLVSLALTWSRGAWIAILISIISFAIIRSRRTPKILLIPALCAPICITLIPGDFIARFLSAFNMGDSSVASRLSIWRSSLRMFYDNILIGVGVGEQSFTNDFAKYAEDSVTAPHSHNLFLEIGCEMGIFALIFFALLLLVRIRHRASYARYVRNSSVDNLSTTAGAALFALLLFGMTDYIWYSNAMYYFFWTIFGIGSATLRISKKEHDDSIIAYPPDKEATTASADVKIG